MLLGGEHMFVLMFTLHKPLLHQYAYVICLILIRFVIVILLANQPLIPTKYVH